MSISDAAGHVGLLLRDHSSQTGAAVNGWLYPATKGDLVAMDHYDAFMKAHYKRPKPYPRPWDKPTRFGGTKLPRDQVIALLGRARNGTTGGADG